MRATRRIALAGLCSILMACAANREPLRPKTYVVVSHDTLYSIAWRHDLDYHDLARWNNIGRDNRLSIGQVLLLEPPVGSAAILTPRGPRGSPPAKPATDAAPTARAQAPLDAAASQARWVWPTELRSVPQTVPGGGILLLGELGQGIRAASAGRVVYTGSGLRAYGNLIIIKHGETLLSSYAHNQELLVHEGQEVVAGQAIARMGMGPHQAAALYFEIRINGKPIDPMPYLPVR